MGFDPNDIPVEFTPEERRAVKLFLAVAALRTRIITTRLKDYESKHEEHYTQAIEYMRQAAEALRRITPGLEWPEQKVFR